MLVPRRILRICTIYLKISIIKCLIWQKQPTARRKTSRTSKQILPTQNCFFFIYPFICFSCVFLNYSKASLRKKQTYIQPKHTTKTIQATTTAQHQCQFPQVYDLLLTCYPSLFTTKQPNTARSSQSFSPQQQNVFQPHGR